MIEMEQFLKEFGKSLKTSRKQMGLSQVIAAQNMRIDYRHYQNIEGGKINLRLDTLMKLVKFYGLDKQARPFNMDSCMDLLSGYKDTNAHDNWGSLYRHFVDGNLAGHVVVNCRTKAVEQINPKLVRTLGFRSPQDLVSRTVHNLLVRDSAAQFDDLIQHHVADQVSRPFIVTFRAQAPANPIPMMAVVKAMTPRTRIGVVEDELLQCIFFDRRLLDEEGPRLKQILGGYQQFIETYPQLKAV